MKIMQVIPYFERSHGGPVSVVHDISNELAKRDHEITICTTNVGRDHALREDEKIEMGNNIDIKYFNCINNKIAYNLKLHFSPQMRNFIKNNIKNFDIVHLHEYRGIPNLYVKYYAKKNNIPYIIQPHGSFPLVITNQTTKMTISKFIMDRLFFNSVLKGTSKIIALTSEEKELFKIEGFEELDINIIPNGVDLIEYENLPQKNNFKRRIGLNDNEKIILFLGRLDKTKGLTMLLDAFFDLKKNMTDVKLVIVGPDFGVLNNLIVKIKELGIENDCILPGPLYQKDKLEAYVDAEVVVIPSIYESFSVTTVESCACGTPVIVTENCGIKDYVENEVGFVVKFKKEDLTNAIYKILSDENIKDNFKLNCLKWVEENFALNIVVDKLEELYSEIK